MTDLTPRNVHMVGSIGLPTVEDVFETCGSLLGRRLKRVPDGEVGGRRLWISWQLPLLRSLPFLKVADPKSGRFGEMILVEGFAAKDVAFGELGYAREARASYADFLEARDRGVIAPGTRFMVALPTPYAVIQSFVGQSSTPIVEPAYEKAMLEEVARICAAIPHHDLALQWDVCIEMCQWDGSSAAWQFKFGGDQKQAVIDRLQRLGDAIPADVELGFHLCYGDMDAVHFLQPRDTGAMVELANRLFAAVRRPIQWLHMPVPASRDDDAFFAPLDQLKVDPETEVYLGLVHDDGLARVQARIKAAQAHLPQFGISTECGIARVRSPELVRKIIEAHVAASKEPAA